MKHAGVHWPENAGGEHPDVTTILGLPGIREGCTLLCSPSARYWYRQARASSPFVVWRAIPRQDKLPVRLGWEPNRVADECLNLWDEQEHGGVEWFLPLNELQFCLVPDQRVTALSATRATMRRYKGDVVTIETAGGHKVTATPNHPILTRQGWLPAGQINEGTEVAYRPLADFTHLGGPDDVQVPTAISEVFRSLQERGTTTRRVIGRDDFHGDGQYGEVDVVNTFGLLGDTFTEATEQISLMQPLAGSVALTAKCAPFQFPDRGFTAAPSIPGVLHPAPAGSIALPLTPQPAGLTTSASRPSTLLEREQERGRHSASQTVSRLAGDVAFVQVAHVGVSQFDGHVYGLTTEDECIYADGIVTHNSKENGGPFPGYRLMAEHLGRLRLQLRRKFSQKYPGATVRLMFPAWVPSDDGDRFDEWYTEAAAWDAICLHAYGSAAAMHARYLSYRSRFPEHGIFVGEWNANHEGHDEHAALMMWAEVADTDPGFLGAAYYIWETNNQGEHDLSIWGNPERLALFRDPPTVQPDTEPEPMTRDEVVALICQVADEHGLDRVELLGGAVAESALDPQARRPVDPAQDAAYWPDVSFGLFQQTARFADEGDQSPRADNVRFIQELYFDPWHASRVAARKFKAYRAREATALDAWCRYNWPAKNPAENPNRGNYAAGLEEARRILGGADMPVKFDPNYPSVIQNDDWSCAPTALTWAMRALGRTPAADWVERDMLRLGLVTRELGLMNHTGAGIVTWLQINDAEHYGSDGYGISNNQNPITWEQLVPEIDPHPPYPLLLGLPHWGGPGRGHWAGVRGFKNGQILLANPDNGATFGHETLTREQFESRAGGNASIVRVLHADLLAATPEPVPPKPVATITRADLDALLVEHDAQRQRIESLRDRLPA